MRGTSGFTLVQTLICIAVFVVMVGCTVGHVSFLSRFTLRAELEHLYTVALYLRRKAMTTGADQYLYFNTDSHSYRFENSVHILPKGVKFGINSDTKGPPSGPLTKVTIPITFVGKKITFYPTGIIQPGTVYMTDEKKEHMYALSVPISQVSFLRLYRYDKKWYLLK